MPITVRHSIRSDVPAIDELCRHLYGSPPGASALLETALLCLTAVDEEAGLLIGFLCLHDGPTLRYGSNSDAAALEWLRQEPAAQASFTSTSYVWVCANSPDYEVESSAALFRSALATLSGISRLLLATSKELGMSEMGLAGLFARVAVNRELNVSLWEATHEVVLPPLAIRRAKVEDHDDMLPVLERADARFPALAKLPESSRPEEAFALTRVVAGQDDRNIVFVAHGAEPLPGAPSTSVKRLVGFMVVTSEVDTSALADAFDLHPFDNFLPPEEYDAQWEAARDSVRTKKLNTLKAKLGERASRRAASRKAQGSVDGNHEATASTDGGGGGGGSMSGAEGEGSDAAGLSPREEPLQQEGVEPDIINLDAAAEPLEEEVKAEMGVMFGGGASEVDPTIFAVTMACIDPQYEGQTLEFLQHAFEAFPDKLYCVLTLPHDSPEPPLVSTFTRIAPIPGSTFPEVLYIFNRHALSEGFEVRMAQAGDASGVSTLVSGMPNSDHIKDLFGAAQERGTAVVAAVGGEVVGLVTINPQVDVALLEANFDISALLHMPHHPVEWHGEIDMLCVNPIFSHRARDLLSGAHRLLHKTALYYALPPAQAPPDTLHALIQVPPRHRTAGPPGVQQQEEEMDADFALYMCSRRSCYAPRRGVNAQVVVVGASEAGLAAVERLLLDPQLSFNYITLLAPGGINVGGVAAQYTSSLIAKLGLDARVAVVDAEMVGLDRSSRLLELSDGSQLPYDVLMVTSGLQEQTCNTLAESDPELAGVVLSAMELATDFTVGDATTMSRIMVYGNTLDAYHALATLEARGAGPKSFFVAPPDEVDPLVLVLRACADHMSVALPEPVPSVLASVQLQHGDLRPLVTLQVDMTEKAEPHPDDYTKEGEQKVYEDQDESGRKWLRTDLIVGCRPPEASKAVFMCLNSSSIVYDGGVVVDGAFRTNDPQIYASGSVAKLSRRYGAGVEYRHYNSVETGTALGAAVAAAFQSGEGQQQQPSEAVPPPPLGLRSSKVTGCSVPGGLTFMFAGCPRAMANPRLVPPRGGRVLSTTSERGVIHVILDERQTVHAIAYLGRIPVPMHRIASLVGLSINYLHGLVERYDSGDVPDLISLLTTDAHLLPVLAHDHFLPFRHSLLASTLQSISTGTPTGTALQVAQTAALEFLKAHARELPGLQLPTPA